MTLLAGAAAVALLYYLLTLWMKGRPPDLARRLMKTGGFACLLLAAGLLAMGRAGAAVGLGAAGFALLGRSGLAIGNLWPFGRAPQRSVLRAPMVDMVLDLSSGRMSGRFTAGPRNGIDLDTMPAEEIIALRTGLDPQSRSLVEAYLDRRAPGWRQHGEADAGDRSRRDPPGGGAMTEQEAYEVLGLQPGAGEAEVRRAHRGLMKKLHPDHGGSVYLASRVNQAKDIILRKHR